MRRLSPHELATVESARLRLHSRRRGTRPSIARRKAIRRRWRTTAALVLQRPGIADDCHRPIPRQQCVAYPTPARSKRLPSTLAPSRSCTTRRRRLDEEMDRRRLPTTLTPNVCCSHERLIRVGTGVRSPPNNCARWRLRRPGGRASCFVIKSSLCERIGVARCTTCCTRHRPGRVKFILPALTEATGPYWRPIKSLACFLRSGWRRWHRTLIADIEDSTRPRSPGRARRATRPRRRPGPGRHPGLHHECVPRVSDRRSLPRARARTSRSAACMSRRCPTKRRRMPTRSSSAPAKTHSRSFCATCSGRAEAPLRVDGCARSTAFRRSAAT